MLKYYIFSLKWLWKNRDWKNSRQKWKALDRDYNKYLKGRG